MIESQNIRQILAILVTDIVDSTEIMNNDEKKGWEYIRKQRDIVPPTISKMHGNMFKEMGDGTLSKFKSAIDAVQCAFKIRDEAIANDLPIRISVHLGDVMTDGNDVIGTGVNIASRINSLGEAGGIVVSEDVWKQIRNQDNVSGTSIGHKDIKGYHQTVEVFEVTYNPDGSIAKKVKVTETVTVTDDTGKEVQTEAAKKEFIKKVAVFPFDFNNADEHDKFLEYGLPFGFSLSMLQDPLIMIEYPSSVLFDSDIFKAKLRKMNYEGGLKVPRPLKKKISNEIHCKYFISGNIKKVDDNFSVVATLYLTQNGKEISEIAKSGSDYFSIIDDISLQLREDLGIPDNHIDETENLPFEEMVTDSRELYRDYIHAVNLYSENNYTDSFDLVEKVTTSDPTFSIANYLMANIGFLSNDDKRREKGHSAMNLSMNHLYKLPLRVSNLINVWNNFFIKGKPKNAVKICDMWIRQQPESIFPYRMKAEIYQHQGMAKEAILAINDLLEKHPDYYSAYRNLRATYERLGDYENALKYAEIYLDKYPNEGKSYGNLAHVYAKMGEFSDAKDYYEQALMLESTNIYYILTIADVDFSLGNFSESKDQLDEALSMCKSNQDFSQVYQSFSQYYSWTGEMKKSIESYEKSCEYDKEFTNPIDHILGNLFELRDYCLIGKQDIALKKQEEATKKLAPPFHLLAGFSSIFIGEVANDIKLVEFGITKVNEFLKIKDFSHVKIVLDLGRASLYRLNKEFDKAIKEYTALKDSADSIGVGPDTVIGLMESYIGNNEVKSAIELGEEGLIKYPYRGTNVLALSKAYYINEELDKCKELLSKALNIWSDADEEYIFFKEAKQLWKKINK